ncbi:MAG: DNA repair exonuclease [Rhodospirillales bacterium]|nr:DNA repair exonuclease [Rhodospirillales bacterium]
MQILHTADIHLDSPLAGLVARAGSRANALTGATRRAFTALVDYAIEAKVDLLLIAGDLYDGDWKDFSTGLFFVAEMARLERAGIRAAVVKGNHDAENHMTRALSWPANVKVFRADKAETWNLEDLGVAVHGRSFPRRDVTENLAAAYPQPLAGLFNVGVLHTAADGKLGHTSYAPCTLADLVAKGYDYWALGHVHGRAVLSQTPWVVFPGNLQGRHVNETGAKGATLVTVKGGVVATAEHVPLDVVRWARLSVDLTGRTDYDESCALIRTRIAQAVDGADGRILAFRLILQGRTALHPRIAGDIERMDAECAGLAEQAGGDVWLERVLVETLPPETIADSDSDSWQAVLAMVEAIGADPGQMNEIRDELAAALARMPPKVRDMGGLAEFDDATLGTLLDGASATLRHRLLKAG